MAMVPIGLLGWSGEGEGMIKHEELEHNLVSYQHESTRLSTASYQVT